MPIYEYQCMHCNHEFDLMEKISDVPNTHCPACSRDTAVRLVSAAGFQLKGTGWYVTDFKDKPKSQKSEATTPVANEPKKAESSSSSKKDEA